MKDFLYERSGHLAMRRVVGSDRSWLEPATEAESPRDVTQINGKSLVKYSRCPWYSGENLWSTHSVVSSSIIEE